MPYCSELAHFEFLPSCKNPKEEITVVSQSDRNDYMIQKLMCTQHAPAWHQEKYALSLQTLTLFSDSALSEKIASPASVDRTRRRDISWLRPKSCCY